MNLISNLFLEPESQLPGYIASVADNDLLRGLVAAIHLGEVDKTYIDDLYARSSFPRQWQRLILVPDPGPLCAW